MSSFDQYMDTYDAVCVKLQNDVKGMNLEEAKNTIANSTFDEVIYVKEGLSPEITEEFSPSRLVVYYNDQRVTGMING